MYVCMYVCIHIYIYIYIYITRQRLPVRGVGQAGRHERAVAAEVREGDGARAAAREVLLGCGQMGSALRGRLQSNDLF